MTKNIEIIESFFPVVGANYVETSSWKIQPFIKGWRYGHGNAIAVIKPGNLLELWNVLKICVKYDLIILMQAANTGLTGGSTPYGNDYDRPVVIINTLRINDIHIIKDGKQIISFPGSTLYELEKKLKHFNREPHSVIGSTSIGASIIGGVCNNSGGSLVHRGPAFTELALYAQINEMGKLELVNELGINLGKKPEEILLNLENINYKNSDYKSEQKRASDQDYEEIVRAVDKNTPARFNSDTRLLHGVSGSAGKLAVFAVRLDTYKAPKKRKVFYLGTNNSDDFWKIRREILKNFKTLPRLGDYLHRECYDAAKKYSKDTFIVIEKLGTRFLPTLFEFKRIVDIIAEKTKFLPNKFSDRLMQFISEFLPNHLTKKMDEFRDRFEHHWIIEMTDEGIDEAKDYFINYFKDSEADFFICNKKEEKKVMLHRYVSASAVGRYHALNNIKCGDMISLDVAYPRNEKNLLYKLPKEVEDKIEMNLCYGHLFCHVLHQNYIVKKGEDGEKIKNYLLNICKDKGAEYPAEHNVGHEYKAKSELSDFYKKLDPTNTFNPGIGKTSKLKNWK
jgi:D-lactate dehydrogenase